MSHLIHQFLTTSACRASDRAAVVCGDVVGTFSQLDRDSDRLACVLQDAGVVRGDRVAIFAENSVALVTSVFGVLKAGGVFVMINATTKEKKLAYILNDCTAKAMIAEPKQACIIAGAGEEIPSLATLIWTEEPPPGAPDGASFPEILSGNGRPVDPGTIDRDLCVIMYTSGTTGRPKGVMLTHRNIVSSARSIATYLENVPEDVVCCVLPMAFSYGLYQMFVAVLVGHTLLVERSFAYPVDVLRRIERYRATGFAGVPGMYATMLQVVPSCGIDLSSVRYMTNAAAPISTAHLEQLHELFPDVRFYSMHGQTECARTCYMDPARVMLKPASVGKAMPNTELYLIDESGRRVGPNHVGQMIVRGANVMRGYWNMPDETAQKLRASPSHAEKVLYTGDLFRMDDEGDLFFVSRMDDIIKCKGEKVSPKEVEDVLHQIGAVAEAAVVGVDDPQDGQAIKAYVVLRKGQEIVDQQIRRYCRSCLESHMVPKYVAIVDSLPKTESGKLKRRDLPGS